MKLMGAVLGFVIFASGLAAQSTETTTKRKLEVKKGREITTTGCVESTGPGDYVLTSPEGKAVQYMLVGRNDLSKHVGHRVEVSGKATDLGNAEVREESSKKTSAEHGKQEESRTTTEAKGNVAGPPLLGVKSIKELSSPCS